MNQDDILGEHHEQEDPRQKSVHSDSAEAAQRRRPRVGPVKVIPLDKSIELHNRDISDWNRQYKENMNEALRHKHAHRLVTLAKKNAEHWMLGSGGNGLLQSDHGPLNMFTGIKLLEAMTGLRLTPGGEKRARDGNSASEDSRRVRPRAEGVSSDEIGRGFDFQHDGYIPMGDDYTIEQGRDQPTALDDRHLSGIFPWNQSTGSRSIVRHLCMSRTFPVEPVSCARLTLKLMPLYTAKIPLFTYSYFCQVNSYAVQPPRKSECDDRSKCRSGSLYFDFARKSRNPVSRIWCLSNSNPSTLSETSASRR